MWSDDDDRDDDDLVYEDDEGTPYNLFWKIEDEFYVSLILLTNPNVKQTVSFGPGSKTLTLKWEVNEIPDQPVFAKCKIPMKLCQSMAHDITGSVDIVIDSGELVRVYSNPVETVGAYKVMCFNKVSAATNTPFTC